MAQGTRFRSNVYQNSVGVTIQIPILEVHEEYGRILLDVNYIKSAKIYVLTPSRRERTWEPSINYQEQLIEHQVNDDDELDEPGTWTLQPHLKLEDFEGYTTPVRFEVIRKYR